MIKEKESKKLDAEGIIKYFKDEFKTSIKKTDIKKRTAGAKKNEIINIWMKIEKNVFKDVIKHLCDYQFPHLAVVSGNDYPNLIELNFKQIVAAATRGANIKICPNKTFPPFCHFIISLAAPLKNSPKFKKL